MVIIDVRIISVKPNKQITFFSVNCFGRDGRQPIGAIIYFTLSRLLCKI